MAKIDQRVTQTGNLSFKFLTNRSNSVGPYSGGNTGTFGLVGWSHNWLLGVTYTQTFTPQVINEFRVGVTRTVGHYAGVHAGTDYNKQLGLPGPSDPGLIGFPIFTISGYDQLGDAPGWPNTYTSTNYNTSDTVTWVKGSPPDQIWRRRAAQPAIRRHIHQHARNVPIHGELDRPTLR